MVEVEWLSALDTAYLRQESPVNQMVNTGLSVLAAGERPGGLGFDDVRRVVASRLHLLPRLRQRIVEVPFGAGRPAWVDDEDFRLDRHLRRVVLAEPGGRRQLEEVVEQVHWRTLDHGRPLWELYVVEGIAGGRTGLLLRFHHALADGMSAMFLAGALLDDGYTRTLPARDWLPRPAPTEQQLLEEALIEQVMLPARGLGRALKVAWEDPGAAAEKARELPDALASLPPLGTFSDGPFNLPVGRHRRVAITDLPLAALRPIRRAAGVRMDDVVLCLVAGALSYLLGRRVATRPFLRTLVPLSDLSATQRGSLGNHGSFVIVDLPSAPMDELERLRLIHRRSAAARAANQRVLAGALRSLWEALPAAIDPLAHALRPERDYVHVLVSYMRGTRRRLHFDGAPHVATYPVTPLAPRLALTIAVVQLGGTLGFGFTGDWDAVPDIGVLSDGVQRTHGALAAAVG